MDNDLDKIFEQLSNIKEKEKVEALPKSDLCFHLNTITSGTNETICKDCGLDISQNNLLISEDKKFYASDDIFKKDQSRCHSRKIEEKTIYKHLDKIKNLTSELRLSANTFYYKFFQKEIHRGDKLKGIIFAIVFNLCKEAKIAKIPEDIQKDLGIDKKTASVGKKEYTRLAGKQKKIEYISVQTYIAPIMKLFNGNDYDIKNVTDLYSKIKYKSTILNSSVPLSVCSALIYYYSKLVNKNISITEFSKITKLSEITITKLFNHISDILKEE